MKAERGPVKIELTAPTIAIYELEKDLHKTSVSKTTSAALAYLESAAPSSYRYSAYYVSRRAS